MHLCRCVLQRFAGIVCVCVETLHDVCRSDADSSVHIEYVHRLCILMHHCFCLNYIICGICSKATIRYMFGWASNLGQEQQTYWSPEKTHNPVPSLGTSFLSTSVLNRISVVLSQLLKHSYSDNHLMLSELTLFHF